MADEADTNLAHRFVMQTVEDRLRELAANLIRIIRGTGKPHEILPQVQALNDAVMSHVSEVGRLPESEALGQALGINMPDVKLEQVGDDRELVVTAREAIISGALQITASRLLQQRTQEAAGYNEMFDAERQLETLRAQRRVSPKVRY